MEKLDLFLSVIDIIICIFDIGLMCYLFFYKFPQEQKKKFRSRLQTRPSVVIFARKFHKR